MTFRITLLAAFMTAPGLVLSQSAAWNDGHLASLDANADGGVSRDEFFQFADYAFKQMDANRSRSLSLSPDEIDPHLVAASFAELDDDGDGLVTSDEFAQQMAEDFAAADKDGDGLLN
ncbi:MAG: EF-hand domain-containing protein [Pseudomonadota bacterium]